MLMCGICLAGGIVAWISFRKKITGVKKRMLVVCIVASALGLVVGVVEQQEDIGQQEAVLARNQMGQGEYEQTLELSIEGYEEPLDYLVTVPEQALTDEEVQQALTAAVDEIEQEFPGENSSVNHVENHVVIREEYQDGKVLATWSFDDYDVMNRDGEVIADEIPTEGILVKASVLLSCMEVEQREEFYFRVFQASRSEQEELLYQIERHLEEEGQIKGKAYYELPNQVGGKQLVWKRGNTHTSEKLLLLGILIASMLPIVEYSRRKEQEEKERKLLLLEYPDMVNKLALLLGAGMTLQKAFYKIAYAYEEKRNRHLTDIQPVYEQMLLTCREMENGVGESNAYERFGERCGGAEYRRLGNLLAQKVRKGNAAIVSELEREAEGAYETRKAVARRYGEEAATKLLFPMVLMLVLVMVVMLVPAVMSFQI